MIKMPLAFFIPKGSLKSTKFPHSMLNVVSRLPTKSSMKCQYSDVVSFKVMNLEFANSGCHLLSSCTTNFYELHGLSLFANSCSASFSLMITPMTIVTWFFYDMTLFSWVPWLCTSNTDIETVVVSVTSSTFVSGAGATSALS